jgi:hypothetical protein
MSTRSGVTVADTVAKDLPLVDSDPEGGRNERYSN